MRWSLLLACCSLACAAAPSTTAAYNNGHLGVLSFSMPGLPAAGHAFETTIHRAAPHNIPLRHLTARCDNPQICTVPAQDLVPADAAFTVQLRALRPGVTSLRVDAVAEDGSAYRDTFCIRVLKPTGMEVTCPSCGDGGAMPAQLECRLFNRAQSPRPLQGLCDATSTTPALIVTRVWPVALAPAWDPGDAVRGASFVITRTAPTAGRVWFQAGALSQSWVAP